MTSVLKVTFYLLMVETDDDFCTKSDFLLTDGRNRR